MDLNKEGYHMGPLSLDSNANGSVSAVVTRRANPPASHLLIYSSEFAKVLIINTLNLCRPYEISHRNKVCQVYMPLVMHPML